VAFGNITGISMPVEFVPGMIVPFTGISMPVEFVPGMIVPLT